MPACLVASHLNNGLKTHDHSGILLIGGEAFSWRPWLLTEAQKESGLLSRKGTLEIPSPETEGDWGAWGVLGLVWPKPDLLILGTGGRVWPISKKTRQFLNTVLGVKVDIMDTANASAAYNLLATERGVDEVAAALLPVGWVGKL